MDIRDILNEDCEEFKEFRETVLSQMMNIAAGEEDENVDVKVTKEGRTLVISVDGSDTFVEFKIVWKE